MLIAQVHNAICENVFCTMAAKQGPQMALFQPKGKQYSPVTWYGVIKGPSDHGYELNLLLAATF